MGGRGTPHRVDASARVLGVATHCHKGHEYTPENTRIRVKSDGSTWRQCQACNRDDREDTRRRASEARREAFLAELNRLARH